MSAELSTPHPIDVHVGARLRLLRRQAGLSQTCLAQTIGLTFQQIQKYERGFNRVSASKLHELAQALEVSVMDLFDGLPDRQGSPVAAVVQARADYAVTPEGARLLDAFAAAPASVRPSLLDLIEKMAGISGPAAE